VDTPLERIFTMFVGTAGIMSLFYAFGVEEGAETRRLRRMERQVARLKDHVILVGFGRVCRQAAAALRENRTPFVVVEKNPHRVRRALAEGVLVLEGDGGDDLVLKKAGIERARGLIVATGSDADNLFIVLTARGLAPRLFIAARAEEASVVPKMLRAGASLAELDIRNRFDVTVLAVIRAGEPWSSATRACS